MDSAPNHSKRHCAISSRSASSNVTNTRMCVPLHARTSLLGLPPELRSMILDEVFASPPSNATLPTIQGLSDHSILRVCRMLHREAYCSAYRKSMFLIQPMEHHQPAGKLRLSIQPEQANEISTLWLYAKADPKLGYYAPQIDSVAEARLRPKELLVLVEVKMTVVTGYYPSSLQAKALFELTKYICEKIPTIEHIKVAFEQFDNKLAKNEDTIQAFNLGISVGKALALSNHVDLDWRWKHELEKGNVVRCRCLYTVMDRSRGPDTYMRLDVYPSWAMLHKARAYGTEKMIVLEKCTMGPGLGTNVISNVNQDERGISLSDRERLRIETQKYTSSQVSYIVAAQQAMVKNISLMSTSLHREWRRYMWENIRIKRLQENDRLEAEYTT